MSARRVWALTVLADPDATGRLPRPAPSADGCRNQGCGHAPADHHQVGFHPGEKWRCRGCDCRGYRQPWRAHAQEALIYLTIIAFIVAFWVLVRGWTVW